MSPIMAILTWIECAVIVGVLIWLGIGMYKSIRSDRELINQWSEYNKLLAEKNRLLKENHDRQ